MTFLYGKPVAERINSDTKKRIEDANITPGLAIILVGDDPASHLYVSLKEKAATQAGIYFEKNIFPETATFGEINDRIKELNEKTSIHGIIVQLPLPSGLPTDEIITAIDPRKDTDGFHQETIKSFLLGDYEKCPVFPRSIIELIRETQQKFSGEKGLVIANSDLMGKVMSQALLYEGIQSEYILSTEDKENITAKTKGARVIVTACGKPRFITGEMLSEGVIIVDGGIEHEGTKVVGDVDQESVKEKAAFLSPVPGGVGPVTVATLLARVTDAAISNIDK